MVQTLCLIPVDERGGLCVIHGETLLYRLLVVVRASLFLTAVEQSCHEYILWCVELNHGGNRVSALGEHLLQSLSLWDGAWESVKYHALMLLAKAVVNAGKYVYHQFVGDELSLVDECLSRLAQFSTVFDFAAEHVACRDMTEAILLNHQFALCSLAGAWRSENYYILHVFYVVNGFSLSITIVLSYSSFFRT